MRFFYAHPDLPKPLTTLRKVDAGYPPIREYMRYDRCISNQGNESMSKLTCAETSKLVRVVLKSAYKSDYPKCKFSVRSSSYAGGSSISVSWEDGPAVTAVDELLKPLVGSSFDSMTDMKNGFKGVWTAEYAELAKGIKGFPELVVGQGVRFGGDAIFTNRGYSATALDFTEPTHRYQCTTKARRLGKTWKISKA